MKKMVSILILGVMICYIIGCSQKVADPIVLPDESSIQSVDITADDELVNIIDIEWIKQCMSNIANAQATAKESVNDIPQVDDYIKIDINTTNAVSTLSVYEKNDKYYIEQPYQGIYETNATFYEMLKDKSTEAVVKNTIEGDFKTYYEMIDNTWMCDDQAYQYRLVITGRMPNAVADSTFVFLSNIEDISFEKAMMASGFSSNMDDYFDIEDAIFVGYSIPD